MDTLMDILKRNIKKIAIGGVSLSFILGIFWAEIKATEKKADSAITQAAKNTGTIDLLIKYELLKQGVSKEDLIDSLTPKPETVYVIPNIPDTTLRDST